MRGFSTWLRRCGCCWQPEPTTLVHARNRQTHTQLELHVCWSPLLVAELGEEQTKLGLNSRENRRRHLKGCNSSHSEFGRGISSWTSHKSDVRKLPGSLQRGLDWSLQLRLTLKPLMFVHSVVNLQSRCRRTWERVNSLQRELPTVQTFGGLHRWRGSHQTEVKIGTCVQSILSRKLGTLLLHKFFSPRQECQSRWSDQRVQPPVLSPKYFTP